MATIVKSEVKIYNGTSATGTQVGQTIVTNSAATAITADITTLGVALTPGSQYCAIARCTNDSQYTSEWTAAYPFKTLAMSEILDATATNTSFEVTGQVSYTSGVLTITECGFYYSTSQTGLNAVKRAADEQEFGQGITITGLTENTTYYIISYAIDNLGREFRDVWTDAAVVTTGYSLPIISINSTVETFSSVTGTSVVTSSTNLTSKTVEITPVGGGDTFIFRQSTNLTEDYDFSDGDEDSDGNTIVILPNTAYVVTVTATNSGGTATATVTQTTPAQPQSTIQIQSITDITPASAVVNLLFGEEDDE